MNGQSEATKLLLIEDDDDDAFLLHETLLEARGARFHMERADRLETGLKRLSSQEFDIVLLDLNLPDSHGLDTIVTLHTHAPEVPILVLTGLDDEMIGIKAVQKGAQDYLVKGYMEGDLLARSIRYAIERYKNMEALQASEERLRRIIERDSDAIVVVDRDGVVCFTNPAAESLFDFGADELIGEVFGFPIAAGEGLEIDILSKGGKTRTAEMRVTTIEWEGKPAYLASLRDFTQRKQAEEALRESEEKYRNLVERANDGITIIQDSVCKYVNPHLAKIWGGTVEELTDTKFADHIHPDELPKVAERYERRMRGEDADPSYETVLVCKDGSCVDVEINAGVIMYQGRPANLVLVRDIGERKELDRMKDEFISVASHELRSPLTSILNALSLIASGDAGEVQEQVGRMADIAYRNSERLLRLINNVLDIGKLEAGKVEFHLQPQGLTPIIKQSIEVNQAYARSLGIKLELMDGFPDVKVNVDNDRLIQVITNLLSNAIKFSPSGGTVDISISHHDSGIDTGDSVRVSVTDHGPGIPEEFRERIFQKFAQARSNQKGGTGLGLSIAKAIVEEMGGQIGFQTETGVGTTFYFDLSEYSTSPVRLARQTS